MPGCARTLALVAEASRALVVAVIGLTVSVQPGQYFLMIAWPLTAAAIAEGLSFSWAKISLALPPESTMRLSAQNVPARNA